MLFELESAKCRNRACPEYGIVKPGNGILIAPGQVVTCGECIRPCRLRFTGA